MFKSIGKIQVNDGIRIVANLDLIRYYKKLIDFDCYNTQKLQLPTHGAHVTIVNPKIHKKVRWWECKNYHGQLVEFEYYPEAAYVSSVNYWLPVECEFAMQIIDKLKVDNGDNWWGLHLTICNKKFN